MSIEAAVAKKIRAAREKPASGRWVRMLFQQRQRLPPVILEVLDFHHLIGDAYDAITAHQYLPNNNVVVTRIIGEKSSESTIRRIRRCEALELQWNGGGQRRGQRPRGGYIRPPGWD